MAGDSRPFMAANLPKWLKGNSDAIAFILAIHEIVELWDDLIDKDNEISDATVNGAFYTALIGLPRNRFYSAHFVELNPILDQAIIDWQTATAFEARNNGDDVRRSYVLRSGFVALTVMAAKIIAGLDWAMHVNIEIRSSEEPWAQYASKFGVQ